MKAIEKKILVVDDDAGIRNSLARILRAGGNEVQVAKDGFEALEIAESFTPDLLLVDIRMPGIDGVETFRRLRRRFPALATIFMTAYASSEKNLEAVESGALSVVSKPLDIEHLMQLASSALRAAPVLIVDDDPALLKSLARTLRASGIEVEEVSSFESAMRAIRQRPDRVVIADVFLQDGLGYELLQETVSGEPPQAFILITGQGEWIESETARAIVGKTVCLPKPVDIAKLIEQVSQQ